MRLLFVAAALVFTAILGFRSLASAPPDSDDRLFFSWLILGAWWLWGAWMVIRRQDSRDADKLRARTTPSASAVSHLRK